MTDHSSPLISVVMATYNRSRALALAIESVRWQTLADWELWVIGDACTDDTEQVVAAFQDPRIHFINLERNVGEQSGPNNIGVGRARGRYLAFLNHDDLWLPDHLEKMWQCLTELNADLVFALGDAVLGSGANALLCLAPGGIYEPGVSVPASCWLMRRELCDEVGPWRFYRECRSTPSQDWLYRAWRAGKKLRLAPHLTVVMFPSGDRPGAYTRADADEHQLYFQRMRTEPDFRARELTGIVTNYRTPWLRWYPVRMLLQRAVKNTIIRLCLALGLDPIGVSLLTRYWRKGGFIDHLRRIRGLEAIPRSRQNSALNRR
jgi:glycosyltransferase involved in cell wall biosynthesis